MSDLRCSSRLHGILTEADVLEVKCNSNRCGAGRGTVVLHKFSTKTGELLGTQRFSTPDRRIGNAADEHSAPVRTP